MRRIVAGLAALGLALTGCGSEDGGDGEAKPPSAPAAAKTSGPTWTYDEILDVEGGLSDVIATAPDDLWVAGSVTNSAKPSPDDGFLLRHDGTGWQRQPMPEALGRSVHEARFDSLGSGEFLLTGSVQNQYAPRTVRWDGTHWTALPEIPGGGRIVDMKAFAADDVWVLADESKGHHWDDTRWTTTPLPAAVTSLDGVAADDLWAVGYRDSFAVHRPSGRW